MTKIVTTIQEIKEEANGVRTFVFAMPNGFEFAPGQYCWISLPEEEYPPSPMAIASGTGEETLRFSVRAWGDLTNALFERSVGDSVEIDGPHGTSFPANLTQGTEVHMVAGGTGITPVRSLALSLGGGNIYYGAKNPSELLYREQIQDWPGRIMLTVDEGDADWDGEVGLVTTLLEDQKFDHTDFFFVCGPKPMEVAVVDYLRQRGIAEERIYVSLEEFDEHGNVVGPVLPVTDEQVEF